LDNEYYDWRRKGREIQKVEILDSFQTEQMVAIINFFYSPTDAQVNCLKKI